MYVRLSWVVLALIHLMPALAFFKPALLSTLYGAKAGSAMHLLLQHRAALFVAICIACLWAAFQPKSRQLAVLVVATSMLSFLLLFVLSGKPDCLRLIAIVDGVGMPFLALAAWDAFFGAQA
jgi:hypothetical protein